MRIKIFNTTSLLYLANVVPHRAVSKHRDINDHKRPDRKVVLVRCYRGSANVRIFDSRAPLALGNQPVHSVVEDHSYQSTSFQPHSYTTQPNECHFPLYRLDLICHILFSLVSLVMYHVDSLL